MINPNLKTEELREMAIKAAKAGWWLLASKLFEAAADRYPKHSVFNFRARRDLESLRYDAKASMEYARRYEARL